MKAWHGRSVVIPPDEFYHTHEQIHILVNDMKATNQSGSAKTIRKNSTMSRSKVLVAQLKELKGVFTGQLGERTIQEMKCDGSAG
ncbi:MAG: hypothetical protein R3F02_13150 [Thiolinea sp.]